MNNNGASIRKYSLKPCFSPKAEPVPKHAIGFSTMSKVIISSTRVSVIVTIGIIKNTIAKIMA